MSVAETITSLIETKTIADNAPLTGKVCAGRKRARLERRARTIVDIVLLRANRVPALESRSSRRREVEGGRNRRAVLALDLLECIRHATSSSSKRPLRPRETLSSQCESDIPFYPDIHAHNPVPFSSLYDAVSTKGYLEVCRIFAWRYASTYVRVCAHPQSSL